MDVTKHEPGMFSWADLGTPDFAGSKQFYTAFLDLEANVMSLPNGVEFCMIQKRGKNVFSIYTMPAEMKQMTGGRPVWQSYFHGGKRRGCIGRNQEAGRHSGAGAG